LGSSKGANVRNLANIKSYLQAHPANLYGQMDIVFSLCANYEWQNYIEGMKTGAKLVMELEEG
jgi:hypothetical protein